MKKYKNSLEMLEELQALTGKDFKKLKINDSKMEYDSFDKSGYGRLTACSDNEGLIDEIMKKHNLGVITVCMEDLSSKTTLTTYATGFKHVNREYWFLCRKKDEAICVCKDKID